MQKRKPSGRLGELLIESGHLQRRDLERALEIQRVAGGHLGTNLLELEAIDEAILLEAIGLLHENPTVAGHRLANIPKEVSSKVPRDLVRRHSIVPFALNGNTVYIASQRPGDIHIENEVTLATSRLTRTFVGLEVRVQEALHRYHGHSLPLRFSRLAAKLNGDPLPAPSSGTPDPPSTAASFVLEPERADSSEWISGSSGGGRSSFANSVPTGPEKDVSVSIPLGKPGEDLTDARQPDVFRVLGQTTADNFDPTLSSTVGRRIKWKDFEVSEVHEGNPDQSGVNAAGKSAPDDADRAAKSSATRQRDSVATPPLDKPAAAQVANQPSVPGKSAVQALLDPGEARAEEARAEEARSVAARGGDSLHQFPFAVRAGRQRKPRANADLNPIATQEPGARVPTIESNELAAVSSPQRGLSTATLEDAHAALLEATNRETVGRILMQGLRPFFKRRVLLAKRGDQVRGWRADGPGVRPRVLSTLSFLVGDGTPFLAIQSGSRFWLSSYRQDRAFDALSSALGPVQAPDCMILPLKAGSFIVGFFYGDNENDTVTGQPLNEFLALSEAAGAAFERIIRRLRETDSETAATSKSREGKPDADPWRDEGRVPRHVS